MSNRQRLIVDVLADGWCTRGHEIAIASETITYGRYPGVYCRYCHATLDSRARVKAIADQQRDARRRDDDIVDDLAIEQRMRGVICPVTHRELTIAYRHLADRGLTTGQIMMRLHINTTQRNKIEAALTGNLVDA